jgi:hypothetical protein
MSLLRRLSQPLIITIITALMLAATPAQAAGTFRFLTTSVPEGSTNGEYFAKLFTANAAGPVEFSVKTGCGAQCDTLPTGILLNTQTGALYGKPTVVEQKDVTIVADDGTTAIELFINNFKVSAAGGGGNSGASFVTTMLPDGRVGELYTLTLQSQGGTGPFIWGAQDLPAGITLNGTTGVVSGTPIVAGTFYVTFTNNDAGEGNTAITTLPLTIYPGDTTDPATYFFKFDTYMLNNGELGTAYSDAYFVTDEDGPVTYSVTGLPAGLTLDSATGIVSGTPAVAGTFYLLITATDNNTTISINLPMWIAPSSSSNFIWNYFGVPAALYGVSYQSSFAIVVDTINGNSVTYTALGLPPGISYNSSTGELSGTPSEVGLFPVVYTATDSPSGQVLTLSTDFVVLPPGGGDVSRLAVNLWIKKLSAKVNIDAATTPNDSWQAQYIYNADRRTNTIFDPLTQSVLLALGNSTATIAAPAFTQSSSGVFSYKTAKGIQPGLQVKGTPTSQSLTVKFTSTELGATMPAEMLSNSIILGSKGYKLKTFLDAKGKFVVTSSYRNASFVVATAKAKDVGSTKDNAALTMYLADPSMLADFIFLVCPDDNKNCNQPTVTLKLYDGINVLLDKDLTALLATTRTVDSNALPIYKMKKVVKTDPAIDNILSSFSFDSKKGLLKIGLKNLVLSAPLDSSQAHIGVELTIGSMSYFTSITLFESALNSSNYNSKISKYATPFP